MAGERFRGSNRVRREDRLFRREGLQLSAGCRWNLERTCRFRLEDPFWTLMVSLKTIDFFYWNYGFSSCYLTTYVIIGRASDVS